MISRRYALLSAVGAGVALRHENLFALEPALAPETAVDSISKAILARPNIKTLDFALKTSSDIRTALRAQSILVLEQNFAKHSPRGLSQLLSSLSENELQLLAIVYTNGVSRFGMRPMLLNMLAKRTTPQELGRLSRYFGFAPLYQAVVEHAPEKVNEFQNHTNPNFQAPNEFSPVPGPAGNRPAKFSVDEARRSHFRKTGPSPNIDMTILEIFLDYRTAPVGSLSVRAALYETAVFAGSRLITAFGSGYAVGTQLSSLIQTYAPDLHMTMGQKIYEVVDWLGTAWTSGNVTSIGVSQQNTAPVFDLGTFNTYFPYSSDYQITGEWYFMNNGGFCNHMSFCDSSN